MNENAEVQDHNRHSRYMDKKLQKLLDVYSLNFFIFSRLVVQNDYTNISDLHWT